MSGGIYVVDDRRPLENSHRLSFDRRAETLFRTCPSHHRRHAENVDPTTARDGTQRSGGAPTLRPSAAEGRVFPDRVRRQSATGGRSDVCVGRATWRQRTKDRRRAMIISTGIDLAEVERIQAAIEDPRIGRRFRDRVFTEKEIAYCEKKRRGKDESYAGRFAAQEAVNVHLRRGCGVHGYLVGN